MYKLENYLEGATDRRGVFTGYTELKDGTVKKTASENKVSFNWEQHYSGIATFGLSPVKIVDEENSKKGYCKWLGFDLDIVEEASSVCKKIFQINPELIVYKSSSNRYHCHYYLDDWIPVEKARDLALKIEKQLINVFKKGVDTSHTVPSCFTIEHNKPGYWLFMPYSPNQELVPNKNSGVCLSNRGEELEKSQCEFKIKWRKHWLISSMVGARSGAKGREKYLFIAQQVIKHHKLDLTAHQVNEQFSEPLGEPYVSREINKHERKDYDQEFNLEYLVKHTENYLQEINGFWRVEKTALNFEMFEETEEQKEIKKEIFSNVIYMAQDDRWFDKTTYYKLGYKTSAMRVRYGGNFNKDFVKEFSRYPERQEVEISCYRPDLYIPNNPIIIDEEDLPQLNCFRPGKLEALPPDTLQRGNELSYFKKLIDNLTKFEKVGWDSKNEEFDLYTYVLDHFSTILQFPGLKIRRALLFHSFAKQIGKTMLARIMIKILGRDNGTIIKPENAISRENSFIENQYVCIDEIKIDGNIEEKKSIMNKLKPLMTDELHDCRPLFKDWRRVFATTSFQLNTNFSDAMALDSNEARYTCIDIPVSRNELGGDEFFTKQLYSSFRHGTLANVVKHFLMNRTISPKFNPAGPCLNTNFLKKMVKDGGHPMLTEVESLFKERAKPFNQSVIAINEVWEWLKRNKGIKGKLNEFHSALKGLGCERVGEIKHKRSGKKPVYYIIRNHDFFCDKLKTDIANKYWLPIGREDAQGNISYSDWNLSSLGDVGFIKNALQEIDSYEQFHSTEDQDDNEELEVIRRKRLIDETE